MVVLTVNNENGHRCVGYRLGSGGCLQVETAVEPR